MNKIIFNKSIELFSIKINIIKYIGILNSNLWRNKLHLFKKYRYFYRRVKIRFQNNPGVGPTS